MERTKKPSEPLSSQMTKRHQGEKPKKKAEYDGANKTISTGSTLLDLAISGGRYREGGIPIGILVEIFGPSGAGKTVLLCQIAGNMQKQDADIMFHDPEARLNSQFASMFGLNTREIQYTTPNTIPEVFKAVRDWLPSKETPAPLRGVFADSLAALSTNMEMGKDEGDKMGMRRAKEFSEELRKTCRIITQQEVLMVCSNQIRQNPDAGIYGQKWKSPGGEAIGFYSSLRLRCGNSSKIKIKRTVKGNEHERVAGVKTEIEVYKSSVWEPYHTASVYILFGYGIDDIRANLRYLKTTNNLTTYQLHGQNLGKNIDAAIQEIESLGAEQELKDEVIDLWNEIESKFVQKRKARE